MAVLGADVTIFDISEDNKRYALEVAESANSEEVFEGEMAHSSSFDKEIRKQMPLCSYRKYTISEIINSVIRNGFIVKQCDEHPAWKNLNIPGEFTLIATTT